MKICIYDDNPYDVCILEKCIASFFKQKEIDYEVEICDNTKQLLDNLITYDMVFLDIEMKDENGIQIGMKIREISLQTIIIITSKFPKYLIEGYKIRADRYFIKPLKQDVFNNEMENIYHRYFKVYKKIKGIKENVRANEILYIDNLGRESTVHLLSEKNIKTNHPLKYWEQQLDSESFIHSHKSFIVNLLHVSRINNKSVTLLNDEEIPLSRFYKDHFKKQFINFVHKTI